MDTNHSTYRLLTQKCYIARVATAEKHAVHRTTIDIDIEAFDEAKALLGTKGYRDTVNGALREVSRIAKLRRAADRIRRGDFLAPTPEELAEMRTPRYP